MSKKKSTLNKLNKFIAENGEIIMTYLRGSMIWNYVRSFFVLDCNTGYLYFFKKTTQIKPTRIMHLGGGVISEGDQHFEDPSNGEHFPSFEVYLNKKVYQIIPEHATDFELLLKEFKNWVRKGKPKGHYRKKVANGAVSVAKLPWKVVSKLNIIAAL